MNQKEAQKIYEEMFPEHDLFADAPDCPCGWSGQGTGPGGKFVRGDRCPDCGELLF